ncbi:TPA: BsuBI/PstI family type II restriction endonuclease [Neisseria polysaccharea]
MFEKSSHSKIDQALQILELLNMPRAQQNERTALCLLCLAGITPDSDWERAFNPLVGITPIMQWCLTHYGKEYAPNTRETFRRQSMHQFVEAGICLYNPDEPTRAVNSPKAVYQLESNFLAVLKTFGTSNFESELQKYLETRPSLVQKYALERSMVQIPLKLPNEQTFMLSVGKHSQLIKDIIEIFGAQFVPNGLLVYVGDTGSKHGFLDTKTFSKLGISLDNHGKLPDVVIYDDTRNWLVCIESVTSHGPVDSKRYFELKTLFSQSSAGLVFISAFPDKKTYTRFSNEIAWETDVWIADNPSHMIHFNGTRFLGPYDQ